MVDQQHQLQLVAEASGWEEHHSELGKTVWHTPHTENSISIVDMNFHQPHGRSSRHAEYCVEACGDKVTDCEDAEYKYFTTADKALDFIRVLMKRVIPQESFKNNIDIIMDNKIVTFDEVELERVEHTVEEPVVSQGNSDEDEE